MAEGPLKEEALAAIQAGRRELVAEAEWLRREMNPKRIATKFAHEHTDALLVAALAAGVGVSWMLMRSVKGHAPGSNHRHNGTGKRNHVAKTPTKTQVGAMPYLTGLLLNAATPLLIKNGLQMWKQWEFMHARNG